MHNNIELNRQDCNVLKGLAIICILLHNFCHLLPNAPQENEYFWTIDNTHYFFNNIPNNIFISFFSFLGHYGVAVFVFLSGYGLVRKYYTLKTSEIKGYVVNHYLKLFKLMFPGFVFYYSIFWLLYGNFNGINFLRLISQLFFVNNIIPTHISPIIPGPYWYFGLSLQLYLIYVFLSKTSLTKQWLFALCCIFPLLLSKDHHYTTVWLNYNFVGYIIPFILGIFYAKYKNTRIVHDNKWFYTIIAFISFIFLLVSELSFYTWIFSSVFVICLFLCILELFPSYLNRPLSSVGRISHIIFVIHPTIRLFVFYLQSIFVSKWPIWIVLYVGLTFCFSTVISHFPAIRLKKSNNDTDI